MRKQKTSQPLLWRTRGPMQKEEILHQIVPLFPPTYLNKVSLIKYLNSFLFN